MSEGTVTVRTRKYMTNRLLARRQMVVDICTPTVPQFRRLKFVKNWQKCISVLPIVFLLGFRTNFGGGKTSGFALIYDSMDVAKKFEPKFRLRRQGVIEPAA